MNTRWLAVVAFAVALGCRSGKKDGEQYDPEPTIAVPTEDLKALADSNNAFAVDLYKKLAEKEKGNLIVSPYSIRAALAMTYAGARGQTADEMKRTLQFTLTPERLHPAFGGVTDSFQTAGKKRPYELNIANALWTQQGMGFVPEFLELTNKSYGALRREVNFGDSEVARGTINRWVEEQTQDRIKELLKPEDIDPEVRLVLTNAIFFKGAWEQPFEKDRTRERDFTTGTGQVVRIPTMHRSRAKIRVSWGDDLSLLSLSYAGNRFEMVFLVPSEKHPLDDIERNLTVTELRKRLNELSVSELDLSVPRFKFGSRVPLSLALSRLGMPTAFSDRADLSGITQGVRLKIKDVIHGGNIEVDEVGTTAAAATAAVVVAQSARGEFQIDRACVFLIWDRQTDTILFMGRLDNPR